MRYIQMANISIPTYTNNINECELHISRWVEMWERMKELFLLLENSEILDEAELEIYNTFKI